MQIDTLDIYVINLKDRNDRWNQVCKNFLNFTNINLIHIDAIKKEDGAEGCFLSHQKCIQIAKDKGLKNILVIEDDCLPVNDFYDRIFIYKDYLDNNSDWSIFLGGCSNIEDEKNIKNVMHKNQKMCLINKGKTTHFIWYNHNIYDFFLNSKFSVPIDVMWHNNNSAIVPVPFLAKQYASFSDTVKCNMSYERKFRKAENILIKLFN